MPFSLQTMSSTTSSSDVADAFGACSLDGGNNDDVAGSNVGFADLPFHPPISVLPGTGSSNETEDERGARFKAAHAQLSLWAANQPAAVPNERMMALQGQLSSILRLNVDTTGFPVVST